MAKVLVLLLWVVAAAMTWWTAPREVSYERALDAVKSGEVRASQWGTGWDDGSDRWFEARQLKQGSGPLFAWRTSDYRVYWADTSLADGDQITADDDQTAADGELIPWSGWIQGISGVLFLTFFAVLLAGPAPALGTRWYWWWMGVLIPYGLGMVFWVLRDRPWTPQAEREDRDRGWFGLVTAILANFLIALVLLLLGWLLGERWVPA